MGLLVAVWSCSGALRLAACGLRPMACARGCGCALYVGCALSSIPIAPQLLRWRPCDHVSRVDTEPWFQALWGYSESVDSSDAAADLIPKVVAECAAPRLEAAVRCRWDVFSSRQTRCLAASIRDVLQYDLPDSVKQVRASFLIWGCTAAVAGRGVGVAALCCRHVSFRVLGRSAVGNDWKQPPWVVCVPLKFVVQKFVQAVVSRLRLAATDLVLPVYVANDSESRGAPSGVTVRSFLLAVKVSLNNKH